MAACQLLFQGVFGYDELNYYSKKVMFCQYRRRLSMLLYNISMSKINASQYKKTKIIATIGPASEEKIEVLLKSGVNGVRLNFSHNRHSWHAEVIKKVRVAARKLKRSVAIIQDLQGPKIRIGTVEQMLSVSAGDTLEFALEGTTKAGQIPIQYDFTGEVKKGERLLLRDGQVTTEIVSVRSGVVKVRVLSGGKFGSQHGINLPDTLMEGSKLTKKDLADVKFGLTQDIDYIALSFIHTAEDIERLRAIIKKSKQNVRIIAKIETAPAVENLYEIIEASDVVMIARGDLATETSPELVPIVGRKIIRICREKKRPVIMATQMLETMTNSLQPTRAEVNDVATAVSLGVDAVMLSGETATGAFPVETVQMMKRIILSSEAYLVESQQLGTSSFLTAAHGAQDAVSLSAITLANHVGAKLIVAETLTGSTALSISSMRPNAAIIMASPDERICNQLSIVWGGKAFLVPKNRLIHVEVIADFRRRGALNKGDMAVSAFGTHVGVSGKTDTVRLLVA